MISLVGTWMDTVAEAWLVYRLTGSSLLLGTVTFAGQIPVFLLAPLGGMVADRFNRRKIVIATQVSSMVLASILAALTLSKHVTVMQVIVLAALMGVVNAFDIPARQSFLVEMVGREDLMNAIALNSSMFNGARIIGPAIAGISGGEHRRRLVLFCERRKLYRGDRGIADDACAAKDDSADSGVAAGNISRRDFVSCVTPRRFAPCLCSSAW